MKKSNAFHLPSYAPSKRALEVLIRGAITSEEETPQDLLERVIITIFSVENKFGTQAGEIKTMAEVLAEYMVENYAMLGTPTLTNAGRHDIALSSCVIIPVDLRN